jgi:hypothetical protein
MGSKLIKPKILRAIFRFFKVFFLENFEGYSTDLCAKKFPLVTMGGQAEGLACADPGARTPIGTCGIFLFFSGCFLTAVVKIPEGVVVGIQIFAWCPREASKIKNWLNLGHCPNLPDLPPSPEIWDAFSIFFYFLLSCVIELIKVTPSPITIWPEIVKALVVKEYLRV